MPQPLLPTTFVLCLAIALAAPPGGLGATWSVDATVSDERKTEITEQGSESTETAEQSYSISYEVDLNPSLLLSLDLTLDITDEIKEPGYDTRDVNPSVEADLSGPWWDLTGSWETTVKSSHDPEEDTTRDDSWNLELTAEPESPAVPDVKAKYQRDVSREGGTAEKVDDTLEGSLDYGLGEWLDVTFDVKRDISDDRINEDSDTEDRDYKVDVSFDKELWARAKFEAEWSNERQQSLTLADDGEILERDDSLKNSFQAKLTYNPLDDLELSLDRQIDWDKDLEQGPLEVTDTWTGEASYGASLTETIGLDLDYSDERKETRGTGSDSYAITRDYSVAADFAPLDTVTLSPSFDRSAKIEWFVDPEQPTDDSVDDTWEVELDAAFWKDQLDLALTRTFKVTVENGERTATERNWDADLTVSYEGLPNLSLSPQYTYTQDDDLLKDTSDIERKWEVQIQYELTFGDVTTFSLDHTYTRTSTDPAEGRSTIQREDDSEVSLSFSSFLEGMDLELSLTRKASDESEDDKGPTVDYTYSVTYDLTVLEIYDFSFEYNYDKKSEAENTRNYQTTFSVEFLDGMVSLNLEYELDQQLQGDKKDTHRYLIELQGQF